MKAAVRVSEIPKRKDHGARSVVLVALDKTRLHLQEQWLQLCERIMKILRLTKGDLTIQTPISSETLGTVHRFAVMYCIKPFAAIPQPLPHNDLRQILPRQYADLILACNNDELYRLIKAAEWLEIRPLLSLTAAKVASMINGRSFEEAAGLLIAP